MKNVIEKAVSICVIIQQDCKVKKKTSTSQCQSFEHNGIEICDQQRSENLEEKKGGVHFMQAWYQENLQTLYQRTTGRQTHVMRTL